MLAENLAAAIDDIALANKLGTTLLEYSDIIIVGDKAYLLRFFALCGA
jgi:hypothetical protein